MKKIVEPSIIHYGDDALLVNIQHLVLTCKPNEYILALLAYLRVSNNDWIDVVPAEESLAVRYNPFRLSAKEAYNKLEKQIDEFDCQPLTQNNQLIHIPVCYHDEFAPDMHTVTEQKALSREEVIKIHSSVTYQVTMIGFTPGFSYLGELPEKLFMPRLAVPKLHLLPGSIGISGYRTGIYPLGGPGGWQIIGCTPMKLFDSELNNPFKLSTGMTIKFSAISIEQFQDYQNKVTR